jgi:hypothetical protein
MTISLAFLAPSLVKAAVEGRLPRGIVAVGRQGDGVPLGGASNCVIRDQLAALLGPDTAAAGEDPRRPSARVVGLPAHDSGVAIGGQRDGNPLFGVGSTYAGADQLAATVTLEPLGRGTLEIGAALRGAAPVSGVRSWPRAPIGKAT